MPDVSRVPFADLDAFSALFDRYCTDYAALDAFYAGDPWDEAARTAAADRAAAHPRDRDALADALLEQNERWDPGFPGQAADAAVRRNIEALRDPDTVAVVTGQQVGVLTGPLYTLYKTLTTVALAARLAEETGRTVVPVFWLPGEDHDFDEVAGTLLLRDNDPVRLALARTVDGNPGPVGRLPLTEADVEALDVEDALRPSDFTDGVLSAVRAAYHPGATLADAFARLLRRFFPDAGLVFVSGDDARLKRLAAPLWRREIDDPTGSAARLADASTRLADAGFHAQVRTQPTNLFLLDDAGRLPIDAAGGGPFRLRGTDRTLTADDLRRLADEAPERLSPNVVLRPVFQDLLLPTVAYVGGPGEVAYFGQLKGVYAWAGVPMPLVFPRMSVTLVESKVQKVLDRYDLTLADVQAPLDVLFDRVVRATMEVDVEAVFKAAGRHLHEAVNTVKPEVEHVDRTLVKTAEATRAALAKEWDRLKGRVLRAEKRNQDELRGQLEKASVNLFPNGTAQERALSPLYFLNKYGLDLPERLRARLSLDTRAHQVVEL